MRSGDVAHRRPGAGRGISLRLGHPPGPLAGRLEGGVAHAERPGDLRGEEIGQALA